MRQSQIFTKTRKEAPKDEVAKNAELLIRAGFIYKEMAGVYAYLPLGLKVLNNICRVIREEMNAIGGQEIQLTALQNKDVWETTNRWVTNPDVDVWFTTKLKNDADLGLGFTHEEPLTRLMKNYISSHKDLPAYVYQIQTKFRNETRAKSGLMRGREFLMKDLYSFSATEKDHDEFYEKAKAAYVKIFDRVGLGKRTFVTFASGGTFSKYSHEFQTVTGAGEDLIYVDEKKKIAVNKEVLADEVLKDLGLDREELVEKKSVEVGNIFSLGTRFSDAFGLNYKNEKGESLPVIMGSYGIGPGRLMGTIAEVFADEKGLVWPKEVAPAKIHLISLGDNADVKRQADDLYRSLQDQGVEVLYDDRTESAGTKFADADLIGIPVRVVISEKNLAGGQVEVKKRNESEAEHMSEQEAFNGGLKKLIVGSE